MHLLKHKITKFFTLLLCICIGCDFVFSQTFNGAAPLPFPPAGTIGQTSSIASVSSVGILGGCKQIEKVSIDLNYTFDGDIGLLLISPDGTFLELSSGTGGPNDNYKITVFKDNAATNIVAGAPPFNGEFQAEGRQNTSLLNPYSNANSPGTFNFQNTFNGINADGDWTFTSGGTINVDLSGPASICPGLPINILATVNPPGTYIYNWSNNTSSPFSGQGTNSISSSPSITTTFTVTVTESSGACTATDEIEITMSGGPPPGVVTIGADPPIFCLGESTTLELTTTNPGNWLFNIESQGFAGITNFTVNVNGTFGTHVLFPLGTTTYTVLSVTDITTGCVHVFPNPISVTVVLNPSWPSASIQNLYKLCEGQTIDLLVFATLGSGTTITYHSSSPANLSNQISNIFTAIQPTTIYALLNANGCTLEIPLDIEIELPPFLINITNATICVDEILNLNTLLSQIIPGQFSGPNVTNKNFTSSIPGFYTITFNPDEECHPELTTTIEVLPLNIMNLGSATMCTFDPKLDLNTLEDPNFTIGNWSGLGVSNDFFNPNGLIGANDLTFTSSEICTPPVNTIIDVLPPIIPLIKNAKLCQQNTFFNLNTLITNGVIGNWVGPNIVNDTIDLSNLLGIYSFTFSPIDLCGVDSTIKIEVVLPKAPSLSNTSICEDAGLFDLKTLLDTNFMAGIWSGQGVSGNTFNPLGLNGQIALSFQSDQACVIPSTTYIQVKNCSCITNSGTMNISSNTNLVCKDDIFTATHNGNQILDNDNFIFVLHDKSGPSLGNILSTNTLPIFGFPNGGKLNTVYYISAVAGDTAGAFIDTLDPCLSISPGVPIQFYEVAAFLNGGRSFCINDSLALQAKITGVPPYTFYLSMQQDNKTVLDTFTSITNILNLKFDPKKKGFKNGKVVTKIIKATDKNCDFINTDSVFTIILNPPRENRINADLCQGEDYIVNGQIYNENKKTGIETITSNDPSLCDSIIIVNLAYRPLSIKEFKPSACKGQTFTINGNIYSDSNPKGVEVLKGQSAFGCDSIVNIDIVFLDSLVTKIDTTVCEGKSISINGTVYNKNYLIGSTKFISSAGCDSIVSVKVSLIQAIGKNINTTLCKGESIVIGGEIFNANKTNGQVKISGVGQNCDTIVNVSLLFYKEAVNLYSSSICENEKVFINGVEYNKNKTNGTEIIKNGTINGCDSTIVVNLKIQPNVNSSFDTLLCNGDSVIIMGKKFNKANPEGNILFKNGSYYGCDSTVNVKINFHPINVDTIRVTIKATDSLVVDNTVFNVKKPSGIIYYNGKTNNGCDSFGYVILRFLKTQFDNVLITTKDEQCPNENNGIINILKIEGCEKYALKVNDVLINDVVLPKKIANLAPGEYIVELESEEGCLFKNTYTIEEATGSVQYILNIDSLNVLKGEDGKVNLIIEPSPVFIKWEPDTYLSCDTCLNVTFNSPLDSILYSLILKDEKNCYQRANFRLNVNQPLNPIVFPNIIMPNSNSNNLWTVFSTNDYTINSVKIYDRWGNKVSDLISENGKLSWDGKLNGTDLIPGVYVYFASIVSKKGEQTTVVGDVTIIK